jgi:thiol-disulfide isomerase/thioredoxin
MSTPRTIPVLFYTRPGCHLCEDVEAELEALAERWPLQISAIDITSDLEIHRRYWDKIPVVTIGGATIQAPIAPEQLAAAIRAAEHGDAG